MSRSLPSGPPTVTTTEKKPLLDLVSLQKAGKLNFETIEKGTEAIIEAQVSRKSQEGELLDVCVSYFTQSDIEGVSRGGVTGSSRFVLNDIKSVAIDVDADPSKLMGTLYDPILGIHPGNMSVKCTTCELKTCGGHLGLIALPEPIFNSKLITLVMNILSCLCYCGHIPIGLETKVVRRINTLPNSPYERVEALQSKVGSSTTCANCGKTGRVPKDIPKKHAQSSGLITANYYDKTHVQRMAPDVKEIFSLLSEAELHLLGFVSREHIMSLLMTHVIVVPTLLRPYRVKDKIKHDDLTEKLVTIVKLRNRYREIVESPLRGSKKQTPKDIENIIIEKTRRTDEAISMFNKQIQFLENEMYTLAEDKVRAEAYGDTNRVQLIVREVEDRKERRSLLTVEITNARQLLDNDRMVLNAEREELLRTSVTSPSTGRRPKGDTKTEKLTNDRVSIARELYGGVKSYHDLIEEGFKGRKGFMREIALAKRGAQGARATVSPSVDIAMDEIEIPVHIAQVLGRNIRVTPSNLLYMRNLYRKGRITHINHQQTAFGSEGEVTAEMLEKRSRKYINVDDMVTRNLLDGDIVVVVRMPTIHKYNMMGFRAKIVNRGHTVGMYFAWTSVFGMDFDGDEISMWLPDTDEVAAEILDTMYACNNLVSVRTSELNVGLGFNALTSWYLASQPETPGMAYVSQIPLSTTLISLEEGEIVRKELEGKPLVGLKRELVPLFLHEGTRYTTSDSVRDEIDLYEPDWDLIRDSRDILTSFGVTGIPPEVTFNYSKYQVPGIVVSLLDRIRALRAKPIPPIVPGKKDERMNTIRNAIISGTFERNKDIYEPKFFPKAQLLWSYMQRNKDFLEYLDEYVTLSEDAWSVERVIGLSVDISSFVKRISQGLDDNVMPTWEDYIKLLSIRNDTNASINEKNFSSEFIYDGVTKELYNSLYDKMTGRLYATDVIVFYGEEKTLLDVLRRDVNRAPGGFAPMRSIVENESSTSTLDLFVIDCYVKDEISQEDVDKWTEEVTKKRGNYPNPPLSLTEFNDLLFNTSDSMAIKRATSEEFKAKCRHYGIGEHSTRALFSALLPDDFTYPPGGDKIDKSDNVIIRRGILLPGGALTSKHIGTGSYSIIHLLLNQYGQETAVRFIQDCYITGNVMMDSGRSFTVGIDDCRGGPIGRLGVKESGEEKHERKKLERERIELMAAAEFRISTLPKDMDPLERELMIQHEINDLMGEIGLAIQRERLKSYPNPLLIMPSDTGAGSKGKAYHAAQMMMWTGQQYQGTDRLKALFGKGDRKRVRMCNYLGEVTLKSQGLVSTPYIRGHSVEESNMKDQGDRDALTDTTNRTPEAGELARQLSISMMSLVTDDRNGVKSEDGRICQLVYGCDGLDASKLVRVSDHHLPFNPQSIADRINASRGWYKDVNDQWVNVKV